MKKSNTLEQRVDERSVVVDSVSNSKRALNDEELVEEMVDQ